MALDEGDRKWSSSPWRTGVEDGVAGQSVTEGLKQRRVYLRIEIRSILMALFTWYVVGGVVCLELEIATDVASAVGRRGWGHVFGHECSRHGRIGDGQENR